MPLTPQERRARNREGRRYREKNENKERRNAYQRRRYHENPKRHVQNRLRRLEGEAGRPRPEHCEICGGNTGGIDFDHCHQRGMFRGWICGNCNTILGMAHDDPNVLRMVIAYLERTKGIIPPQLALPGI